MAPANGTVWGNKVASDWIGIIGAGSLTFSTTNGTSGICTKTDSGVVTGDWTFISYLDIPADRDLVGVCWGVGTTAPTLAQYYTLSFRSAYNALVMYFRKDSLQYGAGGTGITSTSFTHAKGQSTTTMWLKIVKTGNAYTFFVDVMTARTGTPTWVAVTALTATDASYPSGALGYGANATYDNTASSTYWFQSLTTSTPMTAKVPTILFSSSVI